ncbi:flavin-containing monooxygenase [Aspergillus fischeri NRRL 181]|uniref:Monooxygenase n=1 Tax=Neosartorya fischeri (strain ATCC 1020 / DSM 3700 / CBS 544.65 / FGSC A1164 / JCM 1740 / NRRL 181 / WB 181) TaxID=331117 RepID=A1DBZ9_NEOFI|nr:monooxygenase [Aspergillus fischeri NRRL 181]EAW20389.1 monooxygenase [Aspergillus fischeri NRRL 181]
MAFEKSWPEFSLSSGQQFTNTSVVIVGAGIGGMCVAIDLIRRNHCRDFVILEQSAGIGGTWHANTYPGCAVDLQSIVYSYSFAPNSNWSRDFPGQREILSYLTRVAQDYGLYEHIRFCSTAESATWDDELKKWNTSATSNYTISSDFFVSAVGQLSQPKWPEIDGLESFKGKIMHSAAWDWAYDLKDRRIAVVGSGCSAVQIVPELAKVAKKVTVFQRTPHWIVPRGDYEISNLRKTLYRYFPFWQRYWRRRYVDLNETEYMSNNFAEHEENIKLKQAALDMMHEQLPNQPELWEKLTPKYPVGCKRVVVSDFFFPALSRSNVELEAKPIHSINDHTVRLIGTAGQAEDADSDYDLIVLATGFRATDFLHPMRIFGRNGRALHEMWKDGAQAYQGTCADDMPNFGIVLGPNTALLHNSFILIIEAQSRYINGLIKPVLEARKQGGSLILTPRPEKTEEYNAKLQHRLKDFAVNNSQCTNWYKTESGRITNLWPGMVLEFQELMEQVNYGDYEAEGSSKDIVLNRPVHKVGRVIEEGGVLEKISLVNIVVLGTSVIVGGFWMRRLIPSI